MTDPADLQQEVRMIIHAEIADGRVVDPTWLREALMTRHPDITGPDAEWYRVHAWENLRHLIGRVVRELKLAPDKHLAPDPQLVLPGFEHVQRAYVTERDGRMVIVPVDQLTPEEVQAKCEELRRMGKGCYQHADELERYRAEQDSA